MSFKQIKLEITDINKYIFSFYKNPFQQVKRVPSWSWLSLICLIFIFSAMTGLIRGIFTGSLLQSVIGVIFLPITSLVIVLGLSSLFYFLTVIFQNRNLNFKRLSTLSFVASIPTICMYALSLLHPAFLLIGFGFSLLLLGFGLINRFQLNKKFVWITMGVLFLAVFTISTVSYLNLDSSKKTQDFINTEG